jgi:hypothetical protein
VSIPDPVRELFPEGAALTRVFLTGDTFTMGRIATRAYQADIDYWHLALAVANMASGMLVQACGNKAQAVALLDEWLDASVRARVRDRELRLDSPYGAGR